MLPKNAQLEAPNRKFTGHRDQVTHSMARYHFIGPRLSGETLEIGCGRGYGFEVINPNSAKSLGLDLTFEFLLEAHREFPDVPLVCASGDRLPLTSQVFDSIIAFEVIEHVADDVAFLHELKRMARSNALIAISSPNRLFVSANQQKPLNRFHVREYTADQFRALLIQTFSSVELFGQHERVSHSHSTNRILDHIPVRWKYLMPIQLQGLISVALRPPLRLDECRFEKENMDQAHTLVALCRL